MAGYMGKRQAADEITTVIKETDDESPNTRTTTIKRAPGGETVRAKSGASSLLGLLNSYLSGGNASADEDDIWASQNGAPSGAGMNSFIPWEPSPNGRSDIGVGRSQFPRVGALDDFTPSQNPPVIPWESSPNGRSDIGVGRSQFPRVGNLDSPQQEPTGNPGPSLNPFAGMVPFVNPRGGATPPSEVNRGPQTFAGVEEPMSDPSSQNPPFIPWEPSPNGRSDIGIDPSNLSARERRGRPPSLTEVLFPATDTTDVTQPETPAPVDEPDRSLSVFERLKDFNGGVQTENPNRRDTGNAATYGVSTYAEDSGNSYADMAAENPTQGVMQPGSAGASWLPSQIEPTAIEPVNRYPELTDYPQYGNNMDTGAGVNDAFNGVIRPAQVTGPTSAMAVTPSGVGEFDGVYQSGDQMVTDQMNPQQVEQKAGELNSVGMVDDPEWVDIQDQAGVPKASQQQTQAALDEVKVSVPTSNEMSGRDLTADPIMRNFNPDPAQRHADYIKQMNMIMMGGMLLDLAASALGVRSNSGRYMDTQMKILESQMKFDDQQRIDDAVNSVYYPDGEYANPGSQADVFEALMKTGLVKPAEASAISGYHPDQASYKEIYRVGPDGKVETKQVRKDEVTPEGWTDSSGVATFNARLDDEDDPTKSTSAQKNLIQIQEFQTQIAAADELGDVAEANRLRGLLADFKRLSGASGTKQENTISEARQTFTSIYPTSVREMGSLMRADGTPYPWDEYFNDWSRMWSVRVIDPTTGQATDKPGFLQLMQREPAQSSAQSVPLADAIAILRQDPETNLPFFVKRYGVEAVPEDLRGLINE